MGNIINLIKKNPGRFAFKFFWWSFFIITIIDILKNLNTLQRWKWGYWSIDLIPGTIILILLYFISQYDWIRRINNEVEELKKTSYNK